MDDYARIESYKRGLRFKYPATLPGIAALRAAITALMADNTGEANESVVIVQQGFEGGQATGQVTLEPLAKLQAMIEVLSEEAYRDVDPEDVPEEPDTTRYADFSAGSLES